jgi:hypothetical protein
MSGVHFFVEYIAEYGLFLHGVYTPIHREVRCGTHMLSLGQALLWLGTLSTATGNEVFGSVLMN